MKKRSRGGSAKSVGVLLRELGPPSLIFPARAMERILARGEAAVPELLSALADWEGKENRDRSLLAILLGELRHPDAVAPLAQLLREPWEMRQTVPVAAAEALAKIGPPAVPALLDLAEDPNPLTRLFAYGALGAISAPEAYQALLRALEEEPEMALVVSAGVACLGGEASTPALLRALERCPVWQRSSVEEAIRMAHQGGEALPPLSRDWRLRYRLLPRFGVPDPGTLGIAAIAFEGRHQIPDGTPEPVRTLKEILAATRVRDEPKICGECGTPMVEETGIPVCPDQAVTMALMQEGLLESMAASWGEGDLLTLLGIAEEDYLFLVEEEEDLDPLDPDDPDDLEEIEALEMGKEEALIVIRTHSWLLEQGVETVPEGRARLLAQAGTLVDRFGDPEGLLAPVSPALGVTPSPAPGLTPQVGRNDPCPCGSGRKYKKCCGKGEPAGLGPKEPIQRGPSRDSANGKKKEDVRGPEARLHEELYAELYRLARNAMTRREQEEALVRYFGPDFRGKGIQDVHPTMEPAWAPTTFFEWLVFDYPGRSGRTLSEEYLERKGWTLDARSRALLEGAMGTCMSLYRVEEVRPEEGLTLRDLFRGGTVEVLERLGTRELVRWDILAARIQEMDGGPRFTGGLIHLEARAKDKLLLVLENGYVRYRVAHPGADRGEFLKERGDLFYQMGRALADRPRPSLVTSEGDPLMFCRARYRVEDTDGLVERMGTVPSLEPMEDEEGGEGSPVMFRWVEPLGTGGPVDWGELLDTGEDSDPGEPSEPQDGEGPESAEDTQGIRIEGDGLRSLGTLTLEGDRLVLECSSEERLARGKALLEEHLAGAVTHLEDVVKDPWDALEEESAQGDGEKAPPSPGFSPEVEKQLHQELMDRHYRPWMGKPVPALGGKTPREAVATPGGRSRVADLIRQAERGEALRQREKRYAYDFTWLWKELGLDPAKD